jgi:hypothetical protein
MLESGLLVALGGANEGKEADVHEAMSTFGNAYIAVYISGKEF